MINAGRQIKPSTNWFVLLTLEGRIPKEHNMWLWVMAPGVCPVHPGRLTDVTCSILFMFGQPSSGYDPQLTKNVSNVVMPKA